MYRTALLALDRSPDEAPTLLPATASARQALQATLQRPSEVPT